MKEMQFIVQKIDAYNEVEDLSYLAQRAHRESRLTKIGNLDQTYAAVGFIPALLDPKHFAALKIEIMHRLQDFLNSEEHEGDLENNYETRVYESQVGKFKGFKLIFGCSRIALKAAESSRLEDLLSSIGMTKEAVKACKELLSSGNFTEAVFEENPSQMTTFKRGLREYTLPNQLILDCHRYQEEYLVLADAKEELRSRLSLPCSINEENKDELDEYGEEHGGYNYETLLDLAEIAAERFQDEHDSSYDDNSQMSNILDNLIDDDWD